MKNVFYFTLKTLFVFKMSKFLCELFGHIEKRLCWKDEVNFKIYDFTDWETKNCNTYINQYLKKNGQSNNEIWTVNRI